ncbi:matrixin family metalloprotease [Cohnella sp. GCM10012308]|uniref:matrixin family metalloprotease n=1 Tax=Cohnella sp. GCM10012308 TaxID=3317329 RepID=UPI00361826E6
MFKAKNFKVVHVAVFMFVLFFTFASYALAYNNYDNHSCKWASPGTIKYKFISTTPTDYKTIFATAVVRFNAEGTNANMSLDYSETTPNTFGIYNEDSNTMGTTSYTCTLIFGSTINSSDSGLNNLYFYNNPYRKDELQIKVALHELGHFQALGHSSVTPAVMQSGILYYQYPQTDDVSGLNSLYP